MFFRLEATPHETPDDILRNATQSTANRHEKAKVCCDSDSMILASNQPTFADHLKISFFP